MTPGVTGAPAAGGAAPPTRGRRRDPSIDERVMEATRLLVGCLGIRGASVSAITKAAGVGKPSVYLRWANLQQIVIAAIHDLHTPLALGPPGPLEERLARAMEDDHRFLVTGPHAPFMRAVLHEGGADGAIAAALARSILTPRRGRIAQLLSEAPGVRSSLTTDHLHAAGDLLHAATLHDLATARWGAGEPDLRRRVGLLMDGIGAAGPAVAA